LWAQRCILGEKTAKRAFRWIKIQEKIENIEQNFFVRAE
jgi:hypothetical protein